MVTKRVTELANNSSMKRTDNYTIPAGTRIQTRNVSTDLRLRPHVTREELQFDELAITGDGGFVYFFRNGDWLIAVDKDDVFCGHDGFDETRLPVDLPAVAYATSASFEEMLHVSNGSSDPSTSRSQN